MIDLDQAIDQSYREASDAEAVARRLEARIEQIPGAQGLLPRRKYGTPVNFKACLLYTSPSPRDLSTSRMPSSA